MRLRVPAEMGGTREGLAASTAVLAGITATLAPLLDESQITNVALTYLFVTLVASAVWGLATGLLTAVVANLALNFFFVPPLHRFTVRSASNLVELVLFFAVAAVGSLMLSRFRGEVQRANLRETETAVLLEASREVAHEPNPRTAIEGLCRVIGHALGARGCAILAGDPLAVIGASIDSASAAAPTRDEVAIARQALASGGRVRIVGDVRSLEATFVPLTGATGGVLRLIGPLRPRNGVDLDRLLVGLVNEASIALDRAALAREAGRAESLAKSEELKSTLLSSVSHDLRTPLTSIRAAATSLLDDSVEWSAEDRQAFAATIESQSARLTRSVENLLQMSRLESGVLAEFEPVEVEPLLEEAALLAAPAVAGRTLTRKAEPDLWVRADYALLLHALLNLVENAGKHSTPGSPIALEAVGSPGRVTIRVRDSGPGIPVEEVPHVFEKFYRGTTSRTGDGTGLGLPLARAMVETCGGSISVSSNSDGTVFAASLPATRRPA